MKDFEVAHFSPGRLRVRMAQISREPAFGAQLRELLSTIHGMRSIDVNPLTGSLLVQYDPSGLDLESLLMLGRMLNILPAEMDIDAIREQMSGQSAPISIAAGADMVGETLGTALHRGGQIASKVLHPRVALPAMAVGAMVRQLGIAASVGMTPALAAWLVAGFLIAPSDNIPAPVGKTKVK